MAATARPLPGWNANLSVIRPNLASTRSVGLIAHVELFNSFAIARLFVHRASVVNQR